MAAKRAKKKAKKKKAKRAVAGRRTAKKTKSAKRGAKRTAKAKVAKRTPAKKAKRSASRRKEVFGEGNYTASREFDKAQTDFVKKNRSRIAKMGKEAEKALDGPEGDELREAEQEARSHSHVEEAAE